MNTDKSEDNRELERYKITLDFLKFEANTLWQIFNAFFLGSTIFLAITIDLIIEKHKNYPLLLCIAIVGLAITFLWLGTFKRNSDWYRFRMDQAKDAEKNYVAANDDWYLLNKKAKDFADGPTIKGFKNNISGYGMIAVFIAIYALLCIWSLFHIFCDCQK